MRYRTTLGTLVGVVVVAIMIGASPVLSNGQDVRAALDESECAEHGGSPLITGLVYGKPDSVLETAVQSQIVALICGAERGSTIHVGAHYFADPSMRRALEEKHVVDDVDVQVIVDAGAAKGGDDYAEYDDLADEVGSDRTKSSWIDHCRGATRACIGGGKDNYEDALMHNKFLLFSGTQGAKNIVLQTSHNFRLGGSGTGMWNSSYTVADDQVYDHYRAYFDDLAASDPKADDYYENNDLPQPESGKYQIFHSPAAKSNPIMDQLDKVDCTTDENTGGTKDGRTIVRVAMWMISGDEWDDPGTVLARKLNHMDDQGCYVDVVADRIDTAKGTKDGPLEALLRKPKGKYHGPEVRKFYKGGDQPGLHSKDILVDGAFDGKLDQKVVLTGTHNLTWKSARVNDETTLVIKDAEAYEQYSDYFVQVREDATLTYQTSKYKR